MLSEYSKAKNQLKEFFIEDKLAQKKPVNHKN